MKRYALTLDLKNSEQLIAEYEHWHQQIGEEIKKSITDSGIINMEIYRFGTRMFMLMETDDSFSFERKAMADESNPKVQEWEELMLKFQQPLPQAKPGEKWIMMDKIFQL